MAEQAPQDFVQPASFAFDAESMALVEKHIAKYPAGKQASAVLPLLDLAQRPMDEIGRILEMPPIRVYEVCTFYLMFNTAPVGKFHLQLCTTTPCWLRGSDDVVKACRDVTGIKGWKETSADGLFTMTEVECVGACVNAPILQVNDDFYEDMDTDRTKALLEALKRGEIPKPGSMTGRLNSAPEGGPITLTSLNFEQAE